MPHFNRTITPELERLMSQYAVVVVTGPRQAGKSTLVKNTYPNKPYYNLENPDTRAFIEADPRHFFNQVDLKQGIIIDEIQKAPQLLSYIQAIVDENRIPGAFLLTGSHQLALNEAISQSLAGRVAMLELLPLSINELSANNTNYNTNEYIFNGFFPGIYQHNLDPLTHSKNYIKTYVERDVRQLIQLKDLDLFQRFIKLCAGYTSSTVNMESIGNDTGVSQPTIKNWLSILEASYVIYSLPPFFKNFGKRLIKSRKIYFTDTGLISYLLGVQNNNQIDHDKLRGALFENLVINELLKYQYNHGRDANLYFFRDNHKNEVDVILTIHNKIIPIEIKSSATFSKNLLKGLEYFYQTSQSDSSGYLIYTGEHEQRIGNTHIVNYKNIGQMMQQIDIDNA